MSDVRSQKGKNKKKKDYIYIINIYVNDMIFVCDHIIVYRTRATDPVVHHRPWLWNSNSTTNNIKRQRRFVSRSVWCKNRWTTFEKKKKKIFNIIFLFHACHLFPVTHNVFPALHEKLWKALIYSLCFVLWHFQ